MPVATAGHSSALGICRLVTANTVQSRNAVAFWSANDIGEMTMAIITLLRIIRRCMTIYAARRSQDRVNLLPCRQSIGLGLPLEMIATECAARHDDACPKEKQSQATA